MLAGDASILRTGNPISAKPTRVEPFTDGSWSNFTDLGDLSSREDCPHYGLSNHTCATLQQTVCCKGSPRCRWSAVRANVSMAMSTGHGLGVLSGSGIINRWCCLTRFLWIRTPASRGHHSGKRLHTWARMFDGAIVVEEKPRRTIDHENEIVSAIKVAVITKREMKRHSIPMPIGFPNPNVLWNVPRTQACSASFPPPQRLPQRYGRFPATVGITLVTISDGIDSSRLSYSFGLFGTQS